MISRLYLTNRLARVLGVCPILLLYVCVFAHSAAVAQEPSTVTVKSFSGAVKISVQGRAFKAIARNDVLRAGDRITTPPGGEVVLTLSNGGELSLGESTTANIAALTQRNGTQQSTIKVVNGQLRALLAPGDQKSGSAFTIETPNATAGVKFSHPDVAVTYDPETRTTVFWAYTVSMTVRNRNTNEIATMPPGHQAIIQDEFLWISPILADVEEIPVDEEDRLINAAMLRQSRQIMSGAASPAPVSSGSRAKTSQRPGAGSGGSGGSRPQTVTIIGSEE